MKQLSPYTVEAWFPTSIYISDDICNHLLADLEKESKKVLKENKVSRDGYLNVDSTHLSTIFLYRKYPFNKLMDYILLHSEAFYNHLGITHAKLTPRNMWINISNQGDYNFPHTHTGVALSGAFYVKSDERNEIVFYNDAYINKNMISSSEINPLSYKTCSYSCKTGRLLLFPSTLLHGNPKQEFEGEKIVISFNLILDSEYLSKQNEKEFKNSHGET